MLGRYLIALIPAANCGAYAYNISASNAPLRAFGVQQPIPTPYSHGCKIDLIQHLFANSYGQPAIVNYVPPTECGDVGTWSSVVLNLTATSSGNQYDRLASLYLDRTEIWRTSTPEPTPNGIVWTALKDVTRYTALLSHPGTLLLDLGNLLDPSSGLDGSYNVSLSATFYASQKEGKQYTMPEVILPISAGDPTQGGAFHVPANAEVKLTLPRNGAKALVEIYASGNGDEEFWYGNVPDAYFPKIPPWTGIDGYAVGKGPFREVQLLIDGVLAGVVFPYPVIYTGEFLPSIWRPMVSYGALDSPTYYIDITPFLPILSDGKPHAFGLGVVGMGTNHSINADWIVSANVQVWLDPSSHPTRGRTTVHTASPYITPNVQGTVIGPAPRSNVSVETTARRVIRIGGELVTGSGVRSRVEWIQNLQYQNTETYTITGNNYSTQLVRQTSSGHSQSMHNNVKELEDTFTYPFNMFLTYNVTANGLYDYGVSLNHSYTRRLNALGSIAWEVDTTQCSEGTQYKHTPDTRVRTGHTSEELTFTDAAGHSLGRSVAVQTFQNSTTNLTTVVTGDVLWDRILYGGKGLIW